MEWTLDELARLLGAELRGDPSVKILRPVPAGSNDPNGVTFAESEAYYDKVANSQVGAVIIGKDAPEMGVPSLVVDSPRMAFFTVLTMSDRAAALAEGIHPTALVSSGSRVDGTARVGAFCVIEPGSEIGAGTQLFPNCYIGPRCKVGDNTRLMPGVVLVQDVEIGAHCVVHAGTVLGTDGFGYVWDGTRHVKIPQVGGVQIGDNVELGSNVTIDRATSGTTQVGSGVKIDNLVQIGHNSNVGDDTVLAALVGVSGSVEIGKRVIAGGQAGFADHLSVTDDVVLAGRTGLFRDITEPGEYFGVPPTPIKQAMRILSLQQKLPEMLARIRELEREVERLKGEH